MTRNAQVRRPVGAGDAGDLALAVNNAVVGRSSLSTPPAAVGVSMPGHRDGVSKPAASAASAIAGAAAARYRDDYRV